MELDVSDRRSLAQRVRVVLGEFLAVDRKQVGTCPAMPTPERRPPKGVAHVQHDPDLEVLTLAAELTPDRLLELILARRLDLDVPDLSPEPHVVGQLDRVRLPAHSDTADARHG